MAEISLSPSLQRMYIYMYLLPITIMPNDFTCQEENSNRKKVKNFSLIYWAGGHLFLISETNESKNKGPAGGKWFNFWLRLWHINLTTVGTLTVKPSQHAVDGFRVDIPRNMSSAVIFCLNSISYLQ